MDYDFTARMEDQFDYISNGQREWLEVLRHWWHERDTISDDFPPQILRKLGEECPTCSSDLYLHESRSGLFVGCSAYPKCDYTRPWGNVPEASVSLGKDPVSGQDVLLVRGPYGPYVQLGPMVERAKTKPKRVSWPKNFSVATADLDTALKVLSLPRALGNHPGTGKPVEANSGRFGPYVKHDGVFKSIPKSDSVYDIALERAVELLASQTGKLLGHHPIDTSQ